MSTKYYTQMRHADRYVYIPQQTAKYRFDLGADPEFPIEGSANPPGVGGANIQFCQIFSKKTTPPHIRHYDCCSS